MEESPDVIQDVVWKSFKTVKKFYDSSNDNGGCDEGASDWYRAGAPVFIDVGVGIYTKQTFGPDRYDIWTMRSKYHNLPTINGVQQHDGKMYAAKNAECSITDRSAEFSLDIAPAYPTDSQCSHYIRTMYLDKNAQTVTLSDQCSFRKAKNNLELSFITVRDCKIYDHQVLMDDVVMDYDSRFFCVMETVSYQDRRLESIWKVPVRRIVFRCEVGEQDTVCFQIRFAAIS